MTSIPSNFPYLITNNNATTKTAVPVIPGAYIINNGAGMLPIFCSMANLDSVNMQNSDDRFLVMPGFYLVTWPDTNYASSQGAYITYADNTNGNTYLYVGSNLGHTISSCKLYYNVNGTQTEIRINGLS
jgi:hypothetical protein